MECVMIQPRAAVTRAPRLTLINSRLKSGLGDIATTDRRRRRQIKISNVETPGLSQTAASRERLPLPPLPVTPFREVVGTEGIIIRECLRRCDKFL